MTITEDRRDDVGGEKAQPQDSGEVGRADSGLVGKLCDRLSLGLHDHAVEALRSCEKAQQAAVGLAPRLAALDHQPGFHPCTPQTSGH